MIVECKSTREAFANRMLIWRLGMNMIRSIKLFAWESNVKKRIEEKREEELLWYKKKQLLVLTNMNTK